MQTVTRTLRRASLGVFLVVGSCLAFGGFASTLLLAQRASAVQDVRDGFWLSLQQVQSLKAELLRVPRGRLDAWVADAAREPDRRRPVARLQETGLVAVLFQNGRATVAAAPADLPQDRLREPALLAELRNARDLVPVGGHWCLRLPESDVRAASGWLADRGTARLLLAACVTAADLQRAAGSALPRSSELTFWRDRLGLVRIARQGDGTTTVATAVGTLPREVLDRGAQAFDFEAPTGMFSLFTRGSHTVHALQLHDEDRPGGRHQFMYVSRGDGEKGWTGYSFSFNDPVPPAEVDFWTWWAACVIALAALSVPVGAWDLWRRIGRELAAERAAA